MIMIIGERGSSLKWRCWNEPEGGRGSEAVLKMAITRSCYAGMGGQTSLFAKEIHFHPWGEKRGNEGGGFSG